MNTTRSRSESGQAIVVVVVGILALGFMLVLTLDGGILLMEQREAQAIADASALAGATRLCGIDDDYTVEEAHALASARAEEYAEEQNDGDQDETEITFPADARIRVTTSVTRPSAFAGLVGLSTLTASATAGAECIPAGSGDNLLPFVFVCEPPEGEVASDSEDCVQKIAEDPDSPVFPDDYYLAHDSDQLDEDLECIEPPNTGPSDPEYISGEYDCDFNDDGVDDFMDGGDRGWLDPAINPDANTLAQWINDGCENCNLTTHLWLPGQPGSVTAAFSAVKNLEGEIVLFPIFNNICGDSLNGPQIDCADRWHQPPDDPQDEELFASGNHNYYHVIAFGAFHIECVQTKVTDACLYRAYVGAQPGFEDFLVPPVNIKTIEGYFVEVISPDLGPGPALDTGAYVVRLYE